MTDERDREELRATLDALNAAWVEARPEDLGQYFDERMVLVAPDFGGRCEGRAACVESYAEFCRQGRVLGLEESGHTLDVFGDTAVVSYEFAIRYEIGGTRYTGTGRDLFVFARRDGAWRAIWRTMLSARDEAEV